MDLLDSQWFLRMIEAGGKTPATRLLAVFSVTRTWMAAPGIREQFAREFPGGQAQACAALKASLADIAAAARAQHPAVLASQVVILLQGAIAEEIRHPDSGALDAAATAAQAIIAKACASHKNQRRLLGAVGGLSVAATLVAAVSLYPLARQVVTPAPAQMATHVIQVRATPVPAGISPDALEQILVLQRHIEAGQCPAPQLLAMPQGQITAYMNAIHFRSPDNPAADRENARAFLAWFKRARATECYFPPLNGHTNVAWTERG